MWKLASHREGIRSLSDIVFTTAFVITQTPEITVRGDWVEFISQSGDGKIKRYMTRDAAVGMIEAVRIALERAAKVADNVISIRCRHD
jgi:hypothetical protein